MQVADKSRNHNKWPLIITDVEDNMLNVGESLRGKGAPRWFIFLSNMKKKKENTSLCGRLRPRHSQVTPDWPPLRYSLKFYCHHPSVTAAPQNLQLESRTNGYFYIINDANLSCESCHSRCQDIHADFIFHFDSMFDCLHAPLCCLCKYVL